NYLLPESAAVLRPTPFAANMNEPSYVLTVQVLPKEGFKGSVGLLVEQLEGNALLGVRAEEGKWVFKTTEGSFEALLIPNEWQSITWTVTGTLSAKSCAIKVGDKVIAQ